MCGITGFVNRRGEPANEAVLSDQMNALVHRGPDGVGWLVAGQAALGMRRLAIIDLVGGDQPMHSRAGTEHLMFNGEIYNYRELRRELQALGQTFDTDSDTEVIIRGIEQWGVRGCV